jgi:hypothetical protein
LRRHRYAAPPASGLVRSKGICQLLTPFVDHARTLTRSTSRTPVTRQRSADIREWAREHGIAISARGRIAVSVLKQYQAA